MHMSKESCRWSKISVADQLDADESEVTELRRSFDEQIWKAAETSTADKQMTTTGSDWLKVSEIPRQVRKIKVELR